ncbi:hypothetical protein B0T19DRAFT_89320 [Cercophora scortea]|uniref:C2H2-type domain-containing protein n=1 Tax=Cercophora scortea TaxID=314031 RepID=A0AAE0IVA4_9PEZI|nr:hypothetical protein B0T19DRAFT_89320 [Cercophora scortea]
MASLRFIMDVSDDQSESRYTNKRDKDSGTPANTGQLHEAPANTPPPGAPVPHPRHVSSSGLPVEQDISQAAPAAQNKRRGPSTRGSKSAASAPFPLSLSSSSSSLLSTTTAPTPRPPARRRSTTSNDSMDYTGYGSAASSSSMNARLQRSNHQPMRPMPHAPAAEIPMRLTPITGRVSRAKKGVPVHICDICRPAKTFTRAEHLRRHQLSHEPAKYSCTYPGCERAFYRQDLLTRHLERHKQEGGFPPSPKAGGKEENRRPSSASIEETRHHQQPPSTQRRGGSSPVVPGPGRSVDNLQPSSTGGNHQPSYQQPTAPRAPHDSSPRSHHPLPGYNSRPSQGPFNNPFDIHPTPHIGDVGVLGPPPLCVVTQGLPLPSLHIPDRAPGLYPDLSPWTPSTSDSNYSTPASDIPRNPGFYQTAPHPHLVSPSHLYNHYPPSPHYNPVPPQQSYSHSMLEIPGGFLTSTASQRSAALVTSSDSTFSPHHHHPQHHHSSSLSSVRSPTPPQTTASHASELLVIPSPAFPSQLDALVGMGRRKEMTGGLMDAHMGMNGGMGGHGGMGVGYGAEDDRRHGDESGNLGSDVLTALSLPMGAGCGMLGVPMATSLTRPLHGYINVYWARVHPLLPIVHRQSFEAGPENVLQYAMAAVATQYLENTEDRIKGNQLHEHAWQEVKRTTQWTTQVKQAILLCEYFARFRGRKAVTVPSTAFESLYTRVSSSQSLATSSSSSLSSSSSSSSFSTSPNNNALWIVDPSAWSPSTSSVSPSDCSSCASATPTTATMSSMSSSYALQSFSPFPSTTYWGSFPPSAYPSSTSSPYTHLPSSNSSFNATLSHSPLAAPSRTRQSWSSLFSPDRYSPPAPFFFSQTSPQPAGHTYSQDLSHPQALYDNPTMLQHAIRNGESHLSNHDRWRSWVDAEAHRRLLSGCFFVDGHTSIYQQQPRAQDFHLNGTGAIPPVPLVTRSSALWEARSADEWAALLANDPDAGRATFVPSAEKINREEILKLAPMDRGAILGVEALRLPRRQLRSVAAVSANNSPIADFDTHTQHMGSQFDLDPHQHQHQHQHLQHQYPMQPDPEDPLSLDAEERISEIFGVCPVANTYLALHHTPLRDLLAVGGDSWLYTYKVLPAKNFVEHQKRLKMWAEQHQRPAGSNAGGLAGLSAAKATIYAARAIIGFLERPPRDPNSHCRWSTDISDYWGLYVCALICWAFGHRVRAAAATPRLMDGQPQQQPQQQHLSQHPQDQQRQRSSSGGSVGGSSPAMRNQMDTSAAAADREAMDWLHMVAQDNMPLDSVVRVRGRPGAGGVVGLVRRQLESDCFGGKSRLYVDAVGVLRKLEEGADRTRF